MKLSWLETHQRALGLALETQRLGHAPLLQGPAGLGKTELASWLAARILCLNPDQGQPCGRCRSCELLSAGTHPDLFFGHIPEDKTQITVDVIRELSAGLQLTPSIGPHRVGLIEPAEAMNNNAANALLKTLEEPAGQAWLILVSDRPDLLPATVRSRCQKIAVKPPQRTEAAAWLEAQAPEAAADDIILALDFCADAPLKALALLRGDGLAHGREIQRSLLESAQQRPVSPDLAERWAGRASESWGWVCYWLKVWLSAGLQAQQQGAAGPLPQAARPPELARAWQRALEARQLADTPIRSDLLFGKWLLEWKSIFAAAEA
ncbi:MAG: DNA polymerase III subunit delta' [Wenzhouxiangella sp.]